MHVNLTAATAWQPMGLNSWGTAGWGGELFTSRKQLAAQLLVLGAAPSWSSHLVGHVASRGRLNRKEAYPVSRLAIASARPAMSTHGG
jgi:hypothetical protein